MVYSLIHPKINKGRPMKVSGVVTFCPACQTDTYTSPGIYPDPANKEGHIESHYCGKCHRLLISYNRGV